MATHRKFTENGIEFVAVWIEARLMFFCAKKENKYYSTPIIDIFTSRTKVVNWRSEIVYMTIDDKPFPFREATGDHLQLVMHFHQL